jgi:phosphatidylglycerol:prolipoprotein diacylglycerol transferase
LIEININPYVFGNVRWYGVMVVLAILFLILWMLWQVRKGARISYDTVLTAALVGIPSGVVFSRLLHVVDLWSYYSQYPGKIIGGAGLTIYGAVLGATLGIWIYSRFSKIKFAYLADLLAPGVIIAQAIGRVGCLINGCCFGTETSVPWAFVYTNPDSFAPLGVPTQPTVAYEIVYLLAIFGVIMALRGRVKPEGSLFLIYLSLYSVWRLGIDFLREGTPFLFGLHQAQIIAIVTLAITIPLLVLRRRQASLETTPVEKLKVQ